MTSTGLPFEGLLKSRRHVEMREQRLVAMLERERLALEDQARQVQRAITASRRAMRDSLTGTVDAPTLRLHAASINRQSQEQSRLSMALAALHERLHSAHRSLAEASRARRAIELMRERHSRRRRDLIVKTDAEALEELAIRAQSRGAVSGHSL